MIKFDLTSAYHFMDIYRAQTPYLGFARPNDSGEMCYYKFLVVLFGLSIAYIFTKLCRPLISKWRSEGKLASIFLDNGLSCSKSHEIYFQNGA